jgi:hypothetical protein
MTLREGDNVTAAEKELWEYFADLYKNSNKGIKGRGKDRKIASGSNSLRHSMSAVGGIMRHAGNSGQHHRNSDGNESRSHQMSMSPDSSHSHGNPEGYDFNVTEMDDGHSSVSGSHSPYDNLHHPQAHTQGHRGGLVMGYAPTMGVDGGMGAQAQGHRMY